MSITESSPSAFYKDLFFSVCSYLKHNLLSLCCPGNGTQRDFNNNIFAIGACGLLCASPFSVYCKYMALVFQVKQRPHLVVSPHDHMSSPSSVSSVGASFWDEFLPSQVGRTCPPRSRT